MLSLVSISIYISLIYLYVEYLISMQSNKLRNNHQLRLVFNCMAQKFNDKKRYETGSLFWTDDQCT